MNEQKPTLHELLRKFARLRGLPIEEKPNELVCRIGRETERETVTDKEKKQKWYNI